MIRVVVSCDRCGKDGGDHEGIEEALSCLDGSDWRIDLDGCVDLCPDCVRAKREETA